MRHLKIRKALLHKMAEEQLNNCPVRIHDMCGITENRTCYMKEESRTRCRLYQIHLHNIRELYLK